MNDAFTMIRGGIIKHVMKGGSITVENRSIQVFLR